MAQRTRQLGFPLRRNRRYLDGISESRRRVLLPPSSSLSPANALRRVLFLLGDVSSGEEASPQLRASVTRRLAGCCSVVSVLAELPLLLSSSLSSSLGGSDSGPLSISPRRRRHQPPRSAALAAPPLQPDLLELVAARPSPGSSAEYSSLQSTIAGNLESCGCSLIEKESEGERKKMLL
ncbi:uncharacterized protein LOC125206907 [Salvia hispanica]|uniref:uncharacterized protein LOC125206907 n=1 Tax=Salvia hispanica TaxID=49212 RepID=UPI0020094E2C|nr:uncharacterized protein LOC125206907 [Salvia hispanica]